MIIKNTIQKQKVLEYLKSVRTHPTAETVYQNVKKELPSITLATVYRNLNQLADYNKIQRFKTGKEYHFDADISLHQHLVCKSCGKIIDLFQKEISEQALKKVKATDFKPDYVDIIFYGKCKKCKGVKT